MQLTMPVLMIAGGVIAMLMLLVAAFSTPSTVKAQSRRLSGLRERHGGSSVTVEAQMRKLIANRPSAARTGAARLIPSPAELQKRIAMTGKDWKVKNYFIACAVIFVVVASLLLLKGAPLGLALILPLLLALGLPHMFIGYMIKRRVQDFNTRFPDAIELMVRGLRSGLPISETLSVVASELPGSIGAEFKAIIDRIRIGRTMDEALQEASDRLGTAEFQFFCITLAIQRETGGNLAETLANLAEVLRKRAQMKLKIKAMSSEAKASAWIVGVLPFIVFAMMYVINPPYLAGFFVDPRLIAVGLGGMGWMGLGVFWMSRMINFEI